MNLSAENVCLNWNYYHRRARYICAVGKLSLCAHYIFLDFLNWKKSWKIVKVSLESMMRKIDLNKWKIAKKVESDKRKTPIQLNYKYSFIISFMKLYQKYRFVTICLMNKIRCFGFVIVLKNLFWLFLCEYKYLR